MEIVAERGDSMPLPVKKSYTLQDIYALPDGQRAELIDGNIYMMAPPTTRHQMLAFSLARKIAENKNKKAPKPISRKRKSIQN